MSHESAQDRARGPHAGWHARATRSWHGKPTSNVARPCHVSSTGMVWLCHVAQPCLPCPASRLEFSSGVVLCIIQFSFLRLALKRFLGFRFEFLLCIFRSCYWIEVYFMLLDNAIGLEFILCLIHSINSRFSLCILPFPCS